MKRTLALACIYKKEKGEKKASGVRGFTLIEILLAVGIMAILLVIVLGVFSAYRNEQVLNSDTLAVMALVGEARGKTLSSDGASEYGVHFASSTVTLFKGFTFSSSDPENKEIDLNPAVVVSSLSLLGGGNDIIFTRLTGEASTTYGTVTISLLASSTRMRTLVVSQLGGVSQQ